MHGDRGHAHPLGIGKRARNPALVYREAQGPPESSQSLRFLHSPSTLAHGPWLPPRDHPAELARNGPVPTGENAETGPDPAKPPPCEVPVAEGRLAPAVSPLGGDEAGQGHETGNRAMRGPIGRGKAGQSLSTVSPELPGQ
jgi:hypothetical protein